MFLAINIVTILVNGLANLKSNIAVLLCNVILLFLVYPSSFHDASSKTIRRLNFIIVVMGLVIALPSLAKGLLLMNDEWLGYWQGLDFGHGRLWGISTNPNGLALLGFAAMVAGLINILDKSAKTRWKVFYILSIAVEFAIIALSDARSAKVALIVFILLSCFLIAIPIMRRKGTNKAASIVIACVLGLVLAGATYTMIGVVQILFGNMVSIVNPGQTMTNEDGNPILGRSNNDIIAEGNETSGRVEIWANGLEIVQANPILGVGKASIYDEYALVEPDNPRENLHNGYLQLLVSNGILGFVVILLFFVRLFVSSLPAIKHAAIETNVKNRELALILSMLMAMFVINLVESELLYSASYFHIVFWSYIGFFTNRATEATAD